MACVSFFFLFAVNSLPFGMEMDGAGAVEVEVCGFCFDRELMEGGGKGSKKTIRFKEEEKKEEMISLVPQPSTSAPISSWHFIPVQVEGDYSPQ